MRGDKMSDKTATAEIKGGQDYPNIDGYVSFCEYDDGVLVSADIKGLPRKNGVYGFHIHNGYSCMGNEDDEYANTGTHLSLGNNPHPYHSGDLPPLFSNNGTAHMTFVTDRFTIDDIIGHVIIIHEDPDDFTSQPSGNSGKKIACGKIV